jgi:hypothetical protein
MQSVFAILRGIESQAKYSHPSQKLHNVSSVPSAWNSGHPAYLCPGGATFDFGGTAASHVWKQKASRRINLGFLELAGWCEETR